MASAIFVVPIVDSNPALTMEQLQHDDGGELAGGYSCVGQTPRAASCQLRVYASEAQIDALAANPSYLLIEVIDPGKGITAQPASKATIEAYMAGKGFSKGQVDAAKVKDVAGMISQLHGVTDAEYAAAKVVDAKVTDSEIVDAGADAQADAKI